MQFGRILNIIFLAFAVAGGIDYFLDNRFGIGEEFNRGIQCAGNLCLCMIGFMTMAPVIGDFLCRFLGPGLVKIGSDPSLVAGVLFSIDSGGATAAEKVALFEEALILNGYLVASMFGSVLCGQVFLSLMAVKKEKRSVVLLGFALGFASIPFGCAAGAAVCGISMKTVFLDLLPLCVLSAVLIFSMVKYTEKLITCLRIFGKINVAICVLGLILTAAGELCGVEILPERYPFSEIMTIIGQIVLVLAGVFPLLGIVLKLLEKPIGKLSGSTGLSVLDIKGVIMCLVNCFSSISHLPEMTDMGVLLNVCFGVGAGYALGDHFAFVTAAAPHLALPVIVGKVTAGVLSVVLAFVLKKYLLRGTGDPVTEEE